MSSISSLKYFFILYSFFSFFLYMEKMFIFVFNLSLKRKVVLEIKKYRKFRINFYAGVYKKYIIVAENPS